MTEGNRRRTPRRPWVEVLAPFAIVGALAAFWLGVLQWTS